MKHSDHIGGDLGAKRQEELRKAFHRPIKAAGPAMHPAKALPYRPPSVAGGRSKSI